MLTPSKDYTLKIVSYDYTRQKYIDFFLHSKYNPVREAEKFAKAKWENNKVVLLYGFAFGYHIEAILELLLEDQELYIFEMNLDVFKSALEARDLTKILSHPRIHLIISDDPKELALRLSQLLKSMKT